MDALFVVVAELLVVPLVLWALMAIDLSVGVLASIAAVFLGRRTAGEALNHRWLSIRRRLLWSVIFLSTGLLLADIVFFDALVSVALGSADDREDLDVQFSDAEGSFILGRVELHGLVLRGARGGSADPSARFELAVDEAVIDIDTAALLGFDFVVEAIELEGVEGSWDRLRVVDEPRPEGGFELARDFVVDRLHIGSTRVELRDYTKPNAEAGGPRELPIVIDELDMGPLRSDAAIFDLLYRTRGRGSVAGYRFELLSVLRDGVHESSLELDALPLDAVAEPLERSAGIAASGTATLTLVNRYAPEPEPKVEVEVKVQLTGLELAASEDAGIATKVMLEAAEAALERLGGEFPLEFGFAVYERELVGLRSFAESGLIERVSDAMMRALREALAPQGSKPSSSR